MKNKILLIALGEISTGELSIANLFHKSLDKNSYTCKYLLPENKEIILEDEYKESVISLSRLNTPKANRIIYRNEIINGNYDLIVLFDVFTFEYSQDWTGINFDYIKTFDIPIASLDEYEYTKTGYKIDYYGMFTKKLPSILEQCDYIIKNCPMTMPKYSAHNKQSKKEFYYRVFDNLNRISVEDRENFRKNDLKIKDDEKVILFTTSKWEMKGAFSFPSRNKLSEWLGIMVHEYSKEMDKSIRLIHIGSENWNIESVDSKVKYQHYDSLPSDEFEKLLQSADLYLTFNLVSITLSKAIFLGVPAIVLNNSKIIKFEKLKEKLKERPIWYRNMANDIKMVYPFSASMFGWNSFLKPLTESNEYMDTFEIVELFSYKNVLDTFKKTLYDHEYIDRVKSKNQVFIDHYMDLDTSNDILDSIFNIESERENIYERYR